MKKGVGRGKSICKDEILAIRRNKKVYGGVPVGVKKKREEEWRKRQKKGERRKQKKEKKKGRQEERKRKKYLQG
jgi:hypothetical protein